MFFGKQIIVLKHFPGSVEAQSTEHFLKILDQDIVTLCLENQLHVEVIKEQKSTKYYLNGPLAEN